MKPGKSVGAEQRFHPNVSTYVLLSLAFIIVNLATLSNLAPWIDEVMMLDTSYNAAFHGRWETTAWYRVVGEYPFSTYPPLYQMTATVWMWLFGGSLVVVRSLNLLIAFVLGGICLRLMRRYGLKLTLWTTALFTLLFWGTSEMAWMYRNGRPDMLGALVASLTILAIDHYLRAKSVGAEQRFRPHQRKARMAVVASSALLFCSAIQAAVYLFALWLFFFIVMKSRRKTVVTLLPLLLAGFMLGLFLVSLFMLFNGRFEAFVCSLVQYSATLSDMALAVLPWVGSVLDFDVSPYMQKLSELTTDRSLAARLASMAEYRSFLVLSAITLTAYAARPEGTLARARTSFKDNLRRLFGDEGFLLLLCALYVPFFMNLAGRFASYYRWMAFLPLLFSVVSMAGRSRLWCALYGLVAVIMSVFGIRSMLHDERLRVGERSSGINEQIRSFVQRQHFSPSDAVVCPFSVFYDIKPVCDTCYFVGIFPTEYISHVDYIIEAPDGDERLRERLRVGAIAGMGERSSGIFDKPITDYVNKLKADTTITLTVIDHQAHPSLTLYQVKKKNE